MLKKYLKWPLLALTCFVHTGLYLGVDYLFPKYTVVQMSNGNVKRMDKDGVISKANPADGPVRDVYFINTHEVDNQSRVAVFRNEDTGWHFPLYFKFDSADIQARAESYAGTGKLIQIKYYGWRIQLISEFPNILSIKEVQSKEDIAWPVLSWISYLLFIFTFIQSIRIINRWNRRL